MSNRSETDQRVTTDSPYPTPVVCQRDDEQTQILEPIDDSTETRKTRDRDLPIASTTVRNALSATTTQDIDPMLMDRLNTEPSLVEVDSDTNHSDNDSDSATTRAADPKAKWVSSDGVTTMPFMRAIDEAAARAFYTPRCTQSQRQRSTTAPTAQDPKGSPQQSRAPTAPPSVPKHDRHTRTEDPEP